MSKVYKFVFEPFLGADGNLSIRRILAVVFTAISYQYITENPTPDYKIVLALGVIIVMLLGLITAQNIVEISKKSKVIEKIVGNDTEEGSNTPLA